MKGFYYLKFKTNFNGNDVYTSNDGALHYGEIPQTETHIFQGIEGLNYFIHQCPCSGIWSYKASITKKVIYRVNDPTNNWSKKIDIHQPIKIILTFYPKIMANIKVYDLKYIDVNEYADWCRDMQIIPDIQQIKNF